MFLSINYVKKIENLGFKKRIYTKIIFCIAKRGLTYVYKTIMVNDSIIVI